MKAREAVLALAILTACGDDPPPTRTHGHGSDPAPTTATGTSPHATTIEATPDRAPAHLVRSSGGVRVESTPRADGSSLERGQRLDLDAGGEAVIELADGDRITLFGPSVARVGESGAAAMLLAQGTAHVRLPPGPAGPRAPLRVATPEVTVELIGPGEVLIDADRSGATWTAVMAGVTRVACGDADARHHARTSDLQTGQAVLTVDTPAEPTPGPVRLDEARTMASTLFASVAPIEASRLADRLRRSGSELDVAFGWLEAEARHGHDLTDEHRAAVAAGQSDEAMRLQSALVGHAQELHALRDTARLRFDRLSALVLAGAVPAGDPDPLAARRDRAVSLLGLE
ncbi:MAG TPA: hypothetical protein VL400_09155 [Polyangiaceae bacterium]|nr:hypothetical protein [Polyangiaceae bacterium]